MQSDGLNSTSSPVVYVDIVLSFNTITIYISLCIDMRICFDTPFPPVDLIHAYSTNFLPIILNGQFLGVRVIYIHVLLVFIPISVNMHVLCCRFQWSP